MALIHSQSAVHARSDVSRCCQIFHDVITFADALDLTEQPVLLSEHWRTNFQLDFMSKSTEIGIQLK